MQGEIAPAFAGETVGMETVPVRTPSPKSASRPRRDTAALLALAAASVILAILLSGLLTDGPKAAGGVAASTLAPSPLVDGGQGLGALPLAARGPISSLVAKSDLRHVERALRTTASATEPRSKRSKPTESCVPITIMSAESESATRTISSAGSPTAN